MSRYGSCSLAVSPPGAVAPGGATLGPAHAVVARGVGAGPVVARIVHAVGFTGNVSVTVTGV
jgi:hypothetical protein